MKNFAKLSASPAAFRSALLIDADGSAVPFKPDAWQDDDFRALDPAWMVVAGKSTKPAPIRRSWQERPRGHSKTGDLAIQILWPLMFSTRPIRGIAAAADRDQGRLLLDSIATLSRLNNFGEIIDIQSGSVVQRRTGSELQIISSDVASSFGHLVDFVAADEVTIWPGERGEALWVSLLSASAKRSNCILLACGNAGFKQSWCWRLRELVRADRSWYFHALPGPVASWISPAQLAEQERLLPPIAYGRLWLNRWSDSAGDALAASDVDAAVMLDGPTLQREQSFDYAVGVDLAVARDFCAAVLLGKHRKTLRLRVCQVKITQPPRGGRIDLTKVEDELTAIYRTFKPVFLFDPYQGELMMQRMKKKGATVEGVPFSGARLMELADALLEPFREGNVELYPCSALVNDLKALRIAASPAGWKLQAQRTASGSHCDSAVALALAAYGLKKLSPRRSLKDWLNVGGVLWNPPTPAPDEPVEAWQEVGSAEMRAFANDEQWERAPGMESSVRDLLGFPPQRR
jgi:hypothetical protein